MTVFTKQADRLLPSTCSQASLFFAEEKARVGGAYNIATRIDVEGPLDDHDLVVACRRLHAAIPALQVRFCLDPWTGEVKYRFGTEPPEIQMHDCRDEIAAAAGVEAIADQAARQPFDVDEGTLSGFSVIRIAPGRAAVILVAHHAIMDGLSHARFTERFARCLTGPIEQDDPARYAELVLRIREAEQQARMLDGDYWRERIPADLAARAALSANVSPDPTPLSRHTVVVDRESTGRLIAIGRQAKVSLFKVLVAAVHCCLPRTDSAETVVCAASSQRPPGLGYDDVIGCFVNQVPLRARRGPGDWLPDLVGRESARWDTDLRRRNFPFLDLAAHMSRPARESARLDSVMLGYRRTARDVQVHRHGVTCSASLKFTYLAQKTDLSVRFFDFGEELECEVQWGERLPDWVGNEFLGGLEVALAGYCADAPVRVAAGSWAA